MQAVRSILLGMLLLGFISGCGGDTTTQIPENPAPKPKAKPIPVSKSLPADPGPAGSP